MKSFAYHRPASLDEAITLLAKKNGQARPLAGGTDLLVQMRLNLHNLDTVVDIKRIPELNQISFNPTTGLVIGAAVPCAQIYETSEIVTNYPGLIDAASIIGGTAIQGRATLGGNLCNSSPSGDSISAMIVLGATCLIAGPQGTRTVAVEEFCTGPGANILNQGEILVSIQFPAPRPNSGARYLRFIPRQEMDIAVAGAGAAVVLADDLTRITAARIALAAVAPTPLLATAAGEWLKGQPPTPETFVEAARLAQEIAKPITDVRGTAAQRRHLVGVLVRRALEGAVARAKGESLDE